MNKIQHLLAAGCAVALLGACAGGAGPSGAPALEQPTGAETPAAVSTVAAIVTGAPTPNAASTQAAALPVAAAVQGGLAGRRPANTAAPAPGATPDAPVSASLPTVTPTRVREQIALPTPTPTSTPDPAPRAQPAAALNVRSGPGTAYPVIGGLDAGSSAPITGRNAGGDWWQVELPDSTAGWLYAPLVQAAGDTATVAVVANIPAPPTAAPPANSPAPLPAAQAAETPAAPAPTVAPPAAGPDFRVVDKRLWDVYENGGFLVGDSVHCGEKRQLVVNVLDANGSRINGVAVQAEYGAREIFVTGSQGRGDGVVEFVLGGGQDVKVIRDNDGRAVTSEMATGLSTNPAAIPYEYLIAAQYCTDEGSCKRFVDAPGCFGHFSWSVTFQRSY